MLFIEIINHFKSKNLRTGYLYFYVHFVLEIVCFFYLSRITNNSNYIWLVPIIYDALAFLPQSIVGYISDKYPKINMGIIGLVSFCGFSGVMLSRHSERTAVNA